MDIQPGVALHESYYLIENYNRADEVMAQQRLTDATKKDSHWKRKFRWNMTEEPGSSIFEHNLIKNKRTFIENSFQISYRLHTRLRLYIYFQLEFSS